MRYKLFVAVSILIPVVAFGVYLQIFYIGILYYYLTICLITTWLFYRLRLKSVTGKWIESHEAFWLPLYAMLILCIGNILASPIIRCAAIIPLIVWLLWAFWAMSYRLRSSGDSIRN